SYDCCAHRELHSLPTRRSSGLGTEVTFDESVKDSKALVETIGKELPKSARAKIGIGERGGGDEGGSVQVQLVGDSTSVLAELARDIVPILASNSGALRDVRVDSGDQNSELTVRVDRDRAA